MSGVAEALVDARGRPRVVVSGMGVKSPAGLDVDSMWATVLAGKGVARRIERFDPSELPVQFAGEARGFDPEPYFGPKEVRRVDRFTQLGFSAAADAIDHAGDLSRARREPGQPFLRPDDDAERSRRPDLDPVRIQRPRSVSLHRVRSRRQRAGRRRTHDPRRQR